MEILKIREVLQIGIRLNVAHETLKVHQAQSCGSFSLFFGNRVVLVRIQTLVAQTEVSEACVLKNNTRWKFLQLNRKILVFQVFKTILAGNLQLAVMPDAVVFITLADNIIHTPILLYLLAVAILLQKNTSCFIGYLSLHSRNYCQ